MKQSKAFAGGHPMQNEANQYDGNNETGSPLHVKGDLKQINLVGLWFCQCSAFPTALQRCFGTQRAKLLWQSIGSPQHSLAQEGRLSFNKFWKNWVLTEEVGPKKPTFCPHCGIRGFTLRTVYVLPIEKRCSKICHRSSHVTERLSVGPQKNLPQTTKRETCACGGV